jgi:hypothetical protein
MRPLVAFCAGAICLIPYLPVSGHEQVRDRPAQQGRSTSAPIQGGTSPDGRLEVRIARAGFEPSGYQLVLTDAAAGHVVSPLGVIGGVSNYETAKEFSRAIWHPSGRIFVVNDRGLRRSQTIHLFDVLANRAAKLEIPDYLQNALGRVGAVGTYRTNVTEPLRWDGDLLRCELTFDATTERTTPDGTIDRSTAMYRVDFALQVTIAPWHSMRASLHSMGTPQPREPGSPTPIRPGPTG